LALVTSSFLDICLLLHLPTRLSFLGTLAIPALSTKLGNLSSSDFVISVGQPEINSTRFASNCKPTI